MSATVLYMSMSFDGFIAGPNEGPGNGLGDGGHRLHEWFLPGAGAGHKGAADRLAGVNREVMDEVMSTGAVVVGRRTFELADGWGGDHHDGVPIFFETSVEAAVAKARGLAGGQDIAIAGATITRGCLDAGLLDAIQVSLVPVILGDGIPWLAGTRGPVRLSDPEVAEDRGVTHLRYAVRK